MTITGEPTDVNTPVVYSDIADDFSRDRFGDLNLVTNEQSVQQAIETLIMTPVGSRKFLPDYGTSIPTLLFEPLDEGTVILIRNEIRRGVKKWEPRVDLRDVKVVPDYEKNELFISVFGIIAGWEKLVYQQTLSLRN